MSESDPKAATTRYTPDGIYVLRTTQQNQVQLNLMADQKANIIVGVSLIFFTIAHQMLTAGSSAPDWLILPVIILSVTMVGSFLLSILVLIPKLRFWKKTTPGALPNPLFFGFFPSVDEADFTDYLLDELQDSQRAREFLIHEVYQTGVALRKKFVLLRYAYICLTVGVVATIIAFSVMKTGT